MKHSIRARFIVALMVVLSLGVSARAAVDCSNPDNPAGLDVQAGGW